MKARRMDAVWRALDAGERAQLALTAARDGLDPDPAVERLMPARQRAEYAALMRFGLTILTRLRPAAMRLESAVDTLGVEIELLRVQRAWAEDRAALLGHLLTPEVEDALPGEQLEAAGPLVADLVRLREASTQELMEQDVAEADLRAKLTVVGALARFTHAWAALLALESAVPVVGRYFTRDLADGLLAVHLTRSRERLVRAHAGLEELLGPVVFSEAEPDAVDAVEAVLRGVLPPGR